MPPAVPPLEAVVPVVAHDLDMIPQTGRRIAIESVTMESQGSIQPRLVSVNRYFAADAAWVTTAG